MADIRTAPQGLLKAGAEQVQEVKDVGDGKLITTVRDDGTVPSLLQPA